MKRANVTVACVFFLIAVMILSVFIPQLRDVQIDLSRAFVPPGSQFPFGTDRLGRDIFAASFEGIRNSFLIGALSTIVALFAGTFAGVVAGVSGGFVDALFMRTLEIFQAFPGFLLAVALAAFLGPSVENVVLAISAFAWVGFARITRSVALRAAQEDFVKAAVSAGSSYWRVVFLHVLPQVVTSASAQALVTLAGAMLTESSLSFLGVGPPEMESIGKILAENSEFILLQPWGVILPGALFFAVIFVIYVLYDSVKQSL